MSSSYLWLANVPEGLHCRWKVKCSSFNLKKKMGQFVKIESDKVGIMKITYSPKSD